jgi:hypothetical protein
MMCVLNVINQCEQVDTSYMVGDLPRPRHLHHEILSLTFEVIHRSTPTPRQLQNRATFAASPAHPIAHASPFQFVNGY